MYRRILVPVDGSTASNVGRAQAIGLARTEGARLRFLNVIDESVGLNSAYLGVADVTELLKPLRDLGERSVQEAVALAVKKGLRAETAVLPSRGRNISDTILDDARKWRADLIVMSTHGHRGFNRLLLGSDAERVLHDTPVPILLVREAYKKQRR